MTEGTETATFLFTDIEGSTRLLKDLRERYGGVLAEHQQLLRAAFEAHDGTEIDTQGDAFFVAFPTARRAVAAALAGQRALAAHPWPEGSAVRVRMGIHTGEAAISDGRYVGLAVHRAARICAAAHGGQILASHTTVNVLEDEEEAIRGYGLRDLGARTLKDLERPVHLYQVEAEGLELEFPPVTGAKNGHGDAVGRRPPLRRARVATAALVAALVALGLAALAFTRLRDADLAAAPPRSLAYVDTHSNELDGAVALDVDPTAVAFADGAVWVAAPDAETLLRIDPTTLEVESPIGLGLRPDALAAGEDVWVAAIGGETLTVARVEPSLNRVVDRFTVPAHSFARFGRVVLAVAEPIVWVGHNEAATAYRIDTETRKVRRIGLRVDAFAARPDVVWAVERYDEAITRLDPGGRVAGSIQFGAPRPTAASESLRSDAEADADGVWISDALAGNVWRVDALTNAIVGSTSVGRGAHQLAAGGGGLWVANSLTGTVTRLDPADRAVVATVEVGRDVAGIALGAGRVWVAVP